MKKILQCGLFIFLPLQSFASCFNADLAFTGGFRMDEIETKLNAYDPPDSLILQNCLKGKNLDIWEFGLKGRFTFWESLVIKGYADFGWIDSGKYSEKTGFPVLTTQVSGGSVYSGLTLDYSIALGYLFDFGSCFDCIPSLKLGPYIGYSHDYLNMEVGRVYTNNFEDPVLTGLTYKTLWEGAWIGLETHFDIYCFKADLGYEYHFSEWHANWLLDDDDLPGISYSDRRYSDDASGNAVYMNFSYLLCGWNLGLGFKYRCFEAEHGREAPFANSFSAVGLSETEVDEIPKATWDSFQIQASVGYSF